MVFYQPTFPIVHPLPSIPASFPRLQTIYFPRQSFPYNKYSGNWLFVFHFLHPNHLEMFETARSNRIVDPRSGAGSIWLTRWILTVDNHSTTVSTQYRRTWLTSIFKAFTNHGTSAPIAMKLPPPTSSELAYVKLSTKNLTILVRPTSPSPCHTEYEEIRGTKNKARN